MDRRRLLAAMLGAAMVPGVRAQPHAAPRRVAVLTFLPDYPARLEAALHALGWTGRTLRVEPSVLVRAREDDVDREAARIVASAPDVIVGRRSAYVAALARATRTVPIVSAGVADPLGEGLAKSLRAPGGNVTGLSFGVPEVAALQLSTMRELLPNLKRMVYVTADPQHRGGLPPSQSRACAALGLECSLVLAPTRARYEGAVAAARADAGEAVWIGDLPPGASAREVADIATRNLVASIAQNAAIVDEGVLLSVWLTHLHEVERTAAIVNRVLRGESPAVIPFELPEKSLFRLNRTTARKLGLRLPPELLLRVTEFIG